MGQRARRRDQKGMQSYRWPRTEGWGQRDRSAGREGQSSRAGAEEQRSRGQVDMQG